MHIIIKNAINGRIKKCNDTTGDTYSNLNDQCLKCPVSFSLYNIPFTSCTNLELSNLHTCNSLK